jgi:creatinine amidohydrolase
MRKEFDLTRANYGTVKSLKYDVAILPWGATEPHNLHLPYLTDSILSHEIAVGSAELAFERHGVRCMVLPPVTFGSQNPGQQELPFCIHSRYETQKAILQDIVASLQLQGFSRLLIINGHGGNSFKNMIRDLYCVYPDFLIASSEWFKICKGTDFFDDPNDHADELETSVMMHYHPELVNLSEAGEGRSGGFSAALLKEGKVWIPRNWGRVSSDTGIGNPAKATAAKGAAFAEAVVSRYADFLKDFTEEDLDTPLP